MGTPRRRLVGTPRRRILGAARLTSFFIHKINFYNMATVREGKGKFQFRGMVGGGLLVGQFSEFTPEHLQAILDEHPTARRYIDGKPGKGTFATDRRAGDPLPVAPDVDDTKAATGKPAAK